MAVSDALEVRFPFMRYDIALPLLEGRVEIEGVRIKPSRVPAMIFSEDSPYKTGDFDVADLNVCYWLPAMEAGWPVIGLPVFIKRKPVYEYLFVRADRGIDTPKDLEGKRIGAAQYRVSTTIWTVGLLHDRYGVDFSTVQWVVWRPEVFPLQKPARIEEPADPKRSVVDSLLDGEVDAMITDISDRTLFERLEKSDQVKRLFANYVEEDFKLYQETGVFTPAHLIVMNRNLDREHPELAGKLFAAFEEAKRLATEDILNDRGGFGIGYLRERKLEEMARWGDPWKYGITANKSEIDAFLRYNYEQGMIRLPMSYEEVLAAGILDT